MVAVRKVNTEIFRRKLVGIDKKLIEIEYKKEFLQEKLKWLEILSYAPKDRTEMPIQHFTHNYQHYHKINLDSKYLGFKFIRSSFLSKAHQVWDIPVDEIDQPLGAEIKIPLHGMYSRQNLSSGVNRKNKAVYTGSNVLQSEDEASSEGD
uniref:Reverse transcriptase domain-containing protein n=1 Tax=Strongyloides venezuelensis TaxID=75913 RepID=A0A0K0G1Q4_STRVS